MLIRLGNAYVDPHAIESIYPHGVGKYIVSLPTASVEICIDSEALSETLIAAGVLAVPDLEQVGIPLTEAQRHELAGLYRVGYMYIAKDMDGCSYAYIGVPVKHGAYWDDSADGKPQRLTEDYDFLAYEDVRPAFIPAVLGVPVPPDPPFSWNPEVQDGN